MSRGPLPHNVALADQIIGVLRDAHPEALTSSEIAERVGGFKTHWETCRALDPWFIDYYRRHDFEGPYCRAEPTRQHRRFPAVHHPAEAPGMAAQDSWEVPHAAMDMNPILNRLARDGFAARAGKRGQGVWWTWKPNEAAVAEIADLDALVALPSTEDDPRRESA